VQDAAVATADLGREADFDGGRDDSPRGRDVDRCSGEVRPALNSAPIERRLQRAAVIGALLVVAAVVIAIQYSRIGGSQPALPPDAAPQGVDLFWVREPGNPHGIVAYDWTGARRGSATLPTWVTISRLRPAPAGSGFLLDPATQGDYAAYFDRLGRTLFETDDPGFISQSWADDSAHVCVLSDAGLITRLPGEPDRVARNGSSTETMLEGCSVRSDTAILASEDTLAVLRLSTGKLIGSAVRPNPGPVVGSTDASYVATSAVGVEPVRIYRTSDLSKPLAELEADLTPIAFSGDDSLLLARDPAGQLRAVAWQTGEEVWTYGPAGADVGLVMARPSGGDFVVYLSSRSVLVRRDGKTASF
jgi:hypothetical protein